MEAPKSTPAKYFVRFSERDDYDNIAKFYSEHKHHNVRGRDQELMKQLSENGSVVIIEDEAGKIVGAAASYPLVTKDAEGHEHMKWAEIGAVRVVLNGYPGLVDVLSTMSVLRTFLVEPPEDRFVAKIGHPAVQAIATRLGWREYTPDQETVDLAAKTKKMEEDIPLPAGTGTDPKWYQIGIEGLPILAHYMNGVIDNPVLTNKKTSQQIEVDFSKTRFVEMFAPEIKDLAKRCDLGSVDAPDMARSVSKARNQWMKKFFK